MGKWGKQQRQAVTDAAPRRIVEECAALPGCEISKYFDGEGEIKGVKSRELAELGATEYIKPGQKNMIEAVDAVAEWLRNTRDIARSSYVSPRLIEHYMEGAVIAYHVEHMEEVIVAEQGDLTKDERALLDLLKKKLRRELEKAA